MVLPASDKVPDARIRLLFTIILLFRPRVTKGLVKEEPITKLAKLVRLLPVPVNAPVPVSVVV